MIDSGGCDGAGAVDDDGIPRAGARGEFVVVTADPVTGEIDAFGPFDAGTARSEVLRRRHEFETEGLGEVLVVAVALTPPP